MVDELNRCSSCTALGTIHHNEIRCNASFKHCLSNGKPLPRVTNDQLDTDWLTARKLAQLLDKFHQLNRGAKGAVLGRRQTVLPGGHFACSGNFWGDFRRG